MKKISTEMLQQEKAANQLYREAKNMLHEAWELQLAKTKAGDKYNKEVSAKDQEAEIKLAEADALIPYNSEYKKWTVVERLLASSVAEDDPHCDTKRLEVKKWFEYHTKMLKTQITEPSDHMVLFLYNTLSNHECWDGPALNKTAIAKKLMTYKRHDDREFRDVYAIACNFCLEDEINNKFEEYKKGGWSTKYLMGSSNRPLSKLINFWYYCMNVVDVENPDPDIVDNFKKLAGDIEDKQVLYRYGISCAMAANSKEAVEFFWNKLPNKDPKVLIEAATKDVRSKDAPIYSSAVAFCIDQLDSYGQPDLFKELMKEDIRTNTSRYDTFSRVIASLRVNHFYEHLEKVIKHLNPNDFSEKAYEQLTESICRDIISGPRVIFDQAVQFLTCLWNLPGFDSHKEYFQDQVETNSSTLGALINMGALKPIHKILDPMDSLHTKLFTLTCQDGDKVCYNLYTQNEKELLQKLLASIKATIKKPTKKFLEKSDQEVQKELENIFSSAQEVAHPEKGGNTSDNISLSQQAFTFYQQYDRQSLDTLLSNVFDAVKGRKILHKIDQIMLNKLNNMINNTQKSYGDSLFYNSSDSDHHDNPQDDSDSLDSSVLVVGEVDGF